MDIEKKKRKLVKDYQAWLRKNLDALPRGARKELADYLGTRPVRISQLLSDTSLPNKETSEKINKFFEEKRTKGLLVT